METNSDAPDVAPDQMWNYLVREHPQCQRDERCIVQRILGTGSLPTDTYAPTQPDGWDQPMGDEKTFWTSVDITQVLSQYMHAYPNFHLIGPSFIDYDTIRADQSCVNPELCRFSAPELLQRGKTDICIVFNTDTYGGEGIHWIFVYVQLVKKNIVFFDSLGDGPPKEVVRFVHTVKSQMPGMRVRLLTEPHQKKDGECGTYCVFAILLLLTGKKHVSLDSPVMKWSDRIRFLRTEKLSDFYIQTYRHYFMNSAESGDLDLGETQMEYAGET